MGVKLALPAILLAALLVALSTFDSGGPEADLTLVQPNDSYTLDPQRMSWQHDIRVGRAIHEMLVTVDPEPGRVRPGVAERWEVADDGRTWTFRLRPDARWSNGDPVTAADFVAGWRRAMVPDTASDYDGFVKEVEGADDLCAHRQAQLAAFAALPAGERTAERARAMWDEAMAHADRTVRVTAVDDRTLRVTLRAPVAYWLSIAAFPVTAPVHRPTLERFASFDAASGRRVEDPAWTRPENLVCNGRYRVADWRFRRRLRLERNPMHWDRADGPPARIDIVPIEDNNTAVLAYESGAADWVPDVRVEYKAELVAESARWLERNRERFDELRAAGDGVDAALAALPAPGRGERRAVHVLPNFGGWNILAVFGIPMMASGRAAILAYTMPVWGVLFSAWLLREKLTRRRITGLLLGMGGMLLLFSTEFASLQRAPLGAMLMICSAVVWAFGVVVMKRWPVAMPLTPYIGWQMLIGGIPIFLGALFIEPGSFDLMRLSFWPLTGTIYNMFIAFVFCYWVFAKIALSAPVGVSTLSILMTPVVGVFSGVIFLGEILHWQDMAALVMVLAALATVMLPPGMLRRFSPAANDPR